MPFTCQGNENGLAIEGGETIAYEIVSDLAGTGLDHIVIQVGGGALASACAQGLREAVELGAIAREPRLHTVQTTGAHPLERAYAQVRAMLPGVDGAGVGADAGVISRAALERVLTAAAQHRSAYMWPWESEPRSIATGILDDETYDWRAVVGAMLTTGGQPLVVTEDRLAEANELAAATGIPADPTGLAWPGRPARPAAGWSGQRGRARRRAIHRSASWLRQRPAPSRAGDRRACDGFHP